MEFDFNSGNITDHFTLEVIAKQVAIINSQLKADSKLNDQFLSFVHMVEAELLKRVKHSLEESGIDSQNIKLDAVLSTQFQFNFTTN